MRFHDFLPVRTGNLHDPAWLDVQTSMEAPKASLAENLREKRGKARRSH
jgi:hypothetical protein